MKYKRGRGGYLAMMHPDAELRFIDDKIGFGLFATKLIPKGTITWVLDDLDLILSAERVQGLPALQQAIIEKYSYLDGQGRYVLCWDIARYMNHSCETTTRGLLSECDVAIRDIEPGKEVTCDYAELNALLDCGCGSEWCRKTIGPQDILSLAPGWDQAVLAVVPDVLRVAQPLLPYARNKSIAAQIADKSLVPLQRTQYISAPTSSRA